MIAAEHQLSAIGPGRILLTGSFAPNAAANPLATASRGRDHGNTFVVTYAATGLYTLTFPSGYTLPAQPGSIVVTPQWDTIANWFDVAVVGDTTLNTTSRSLVIQAHRSGVAQAPTAGTGCRINFSLLVSNNTGT